MTDSMTTTMTPMTHYEYDSMMIMSHYDYGSGLL